MNYDSEMPADILNYFLWCLGTLLFFGIIAFLRWISLDTDDAHKITHPEPPADKPIGWFEVGRLQGKITLLGKPDNEKAI